MTTNTENSNVTSIEKPFVDGRSLRKVRGPKGASTRVPWSGGLSQDEIARPGGILLAMLVQRANELGHQLGAMAEALNVTYGYISQLRSGVRKTEHISDHFASACALYLNAPRMTVLLASGRVKSEDVFEDPEEMISVLPRAIQFIKSDSTYGPLMPHDVLNADEKMQYFIVTLFENATGRTLLPGRSNPVDIAKQIEHFKSVRNKLMAEVASGNTTKVNTLSDAEEEQT